MSDIYTIIVEEYWYFYYNKYILNKYNKIIEIG